MNRLVISVSSVTEHGAKVNVELPGELVAGKDLASKDLASKDSAGGGGEGPGGLQSGPIRVAGRVEAIDTELLFRGSLRGEWVHPCDRCLRPSRTPYAIDVMWLFEPGDDATEGLASYEMSSETDEEEPVRYFNGKELDLTDHVREELLLAAPSKFLCSEDCRGLCPRCGANLNEGQCGCPAERGSGGLSDLAERLAAFEQRSVITKKRTPQSRSSKE